MVICRLDFVVCPVSPTPRTFTIFPFTTSRTPFLIRKNMTRWELSKSPDFALTQSHSSPTLPWLLHVETQLTFQLHCQLTSTCNWWSLYADINGFLSPSIITGDNYHPDLLFLIRSKCLHILELTVGFESNLKNNAMYKKGKIHKLDRRHEK